MHRILASSLALTLLVSACQMKGPTQAPTSKKPVAVNTVPMTSLAGSLRMDASYVVAAGGGNVIAPGGGNVIAAGGGNLIKVGGQVIAAGGGNVIAAGGGNVVAAGGGNAVAGGGLNFRLFATGVTFGEVLPAAGMVVVPISLRTGKPLGEAVLTDAQGRYALKIPKSESGNVRVYAAVPAKTATDPLLDNQRLRYEYLTASDATEQANVIDEDSALVSHYTRKAFAGRMKGLLETSNSQGNWGVILEQWMQGGNNAFIRTLLDGMRAEMAAAKTYELPTAEREALAYRLADTIIYHVDLDQAMIDKSVPEWQGNPDEPAITALVDLMRRLRTAAVKQLAEDPTSLDNAALVQLVNEDRKQKGLPPYTFLKATDFADFVVTEFLSVNDGMMFFRMADVFNTLGIEETQVGRLKAAQLGLLTTVGMTMVTNADAKQDFLSLIKESAQAKAND